MDGHSIINNYYLINQFNSGPFQHTIFMDDADIISLSLPLIEKKIIRKKYKKVKSEHTTMNT